MFLEVLVFCILGICLCVCSAAKWYLRCKDSLLMLFKFVSFIISPKTQHVGFLLSFLIATLHHLNLEPVEACTTANNTWYNGDGHTKVYILFPSTCLISCSSALCCYCLWWPFMLKVTHVAKCSCPQTHVQMSQSLSLSFI